MIDYARAKAKRDSCHFFRQSTSIYPKPCCEKIGYKRPFLATCYSCRLYAPRTPITRIIHHKLSEQKSCIVCGAQLSSGSIKRCSGQCRNSLLAYFSRRKIIIEEIQNEEDLYGVPLT